MEYILLSFGEIRRQQFKSKEENTIFASFSTGDSAQRFPQARQIHYPCVVSQTHCTFYFETKFCGFCLG